MWCGFRGSGKRVASLSIELGVDFEPFRIELQRLHKHRKVQQMRHHYSGQGKKPRNSNH